MCQLVCSSTLLLLLLGGLPATAAPPPAPTAKAPAVKTPTPQLSDAALEKRIRDRLARSKIGVNGFQVKVQAGVATLTGRTEIIQHKGTATRLAKSAGAKRVDNQIQVSEAAKKKAANQLAKNKGSAPRKVQVQRPPGN